MKKRPLIVIRLFIISVLFITLATSCKKDNDDTETVTDIDGNVYKTVTIGTQVWFKENLKTTKYNDGSAIPMVTDNYEWGWSTGGYRTTPGYCWYDNNASMKGTYGALYNWYTVHTGKLCPTGWHVPTDADWTTLTDLLGGLGEAGGILKEKGTSHWRSPNTGATDEKEFTALPGGYRYSDGEFYSLGDEGIWWSATESGGDNAFAMFFKYDVSDVDRGGDNKRIGFSVRCIKD